VSDALALSDIDAYYGDSHVLHRVSLRLGEGRLLGLLGRGFRAGRLRLARGGQSRREQGESQTTQHQGAGTTV